MTAVQQLIHDMRNIDMSIFNDEHCKKYLEMEKQQIKDAWNNGAYCGDTINIETSEDYYNETYGGKGSDETNGNNVEKVPNVTSSQAVSDEEIEEQAKLKYPYNGFNDNDIKGMIISGQRGAWIDAIKWYREQLKKKQ